MTAVGTMITGRYRLVQQLAVGGMGSVWEAWDELLQRPVAVKQLLTQPGLFIALLIYAADLLLAFFVQRPGLRRLIGMGRFANDADRDRWRGWARRQRYVSYVMAAMVGFIAFLMSTKPSF